MDAKMQSHQQHMCRMRPHFFRPSHLLCNYKRYNKLFGHSAIENAIKWNFTHFFSSPWQALKNGRRTDRRHVKEEKCKFVVVFVELSANSSGAYFGPRNAEPWIQFNFSCKHTVSVVCFIFHVFVSHKAAAHCFMIRPFFRFVRSPQVAHIINC